MRYLRLTQDIRSAPRSPTRPGRVGRYLLTVGAGTLLSGLAAAATVVDCLAVADDVERLACYDGIARALQQGGADEAPVSATTDWRDERSRQPPPQDIASRILSVDTLPGGERAMQLANGQVWAEIEPGRRPIDADQEVVIVVHRWRTVMRLANGPSITVRRVR
ncbi:MAG: hypothetical protein R3E86_21535 [Pseudomonadales bacterium]